MMQLRIVFFQVRNKVPSCVRAIERVKWVKDGKPAITPLEAAEEIFAAKPEIFKNEKPSDQLLCFLLLLSRGNKTALEVVQLLGEQNDRSFSVDTALEVLNEELKEECEKCRERARRILERLQKIRSSTPA